MKKNRLVRHAAALAFGIASGHAFAEINIGVILSLTGPAASLGIPAKSTVALWPKEIAGQKLNVTVLDDASDSTAATVAARRLVQENRVDVLVGPSVTPTSLAALQVAGESATPMISLGGSGALIHPQEGPRRWVFKMPPSEEIQLAVIFEQMKRNHEKTLGFVAINNAYAQTFLDVAQKMAPQNGVKIVDVERYNATDTSFVSQALKLIAAKPDAMFIAAAGTPAATPHIEIRQRGYGKTIYQTQAVANNDFLRVGGKSLEGTYLPVSPLLVAEQLPQDNPVKPVALDYLKRYEGQHGPDSRSLFGGLAWDAWLILDRALPIALKSAQPGTAAFRQALRDAIENGQELVLTHGVYKMSPTDHNGADKRSQVMVKIEGGKWRYVPETTSPSK
ncbi:ABC transporter substrate-binding protein [Noviherbaspirillum pedocola]|uniref:ABC transporter substrate-binding protein n=1 Tax=Noviherbaspirillum pedocola TaxID=2801341 RepID=A0A934SYS3_9BURK|nr:ABC transporter substrate-binding protein [Noviherbaspirillum pedocola]MBK4737780.1 ABC transporter substrate-binding protein [Noviherbaspirillum pedocola]